MKNNINGNPFDCQMCKIGKSGYKFCSGKCDFDSKLKRVFTLENRIETLERLSVIYTESKNKKRIRKMILTTRKKHRILESHLDKQL